MVVIALAKIDYGRLFTLRKDGRYVATYRDKDGKHFVYDKDPERLWHKLNDPKPEKQYTFQEASIDWQREHWEEITHNTAESYVAPLRRINKQFGESALDEITASQVYAFLVSLGKQGFSRRSVQMHRDIMNMVFNSAIVKNKADINPCTSISLPRNLKTTKRELPSDAAIEAVKNGLDKPFGLFAFLCLYSGLRRGEALALRYEDIDRENACIHVSKAVEFIVNNPHIKSTKTEAGNRDVILLDLLAKAIPKKKTGYVFCRDDGGLLTKTQYVKRWDAYCKAIGYKITAHQLRHGYATILFEAEINDKDAQDLLGHTNITTTRNIYTHIRQSRKAETATRLNSFVEKMNRPQE